MLDDHHFQADRTRRVTARVEHKRRASNGSAARFRCLIENNADGIAVVDRRGIVRFVNPALGTIFGCDPEDLPCEPFGLPMVPGKTTEVSVIGKDLVPRTVEIRVVETVWEGEDVFLASLRDITDRKQAEAHLKLRAQLLDAATDSIMLHDLDGNIEYGNEAAYRSRGYTRDEFMKLNVHNHVVASESPHYSRKRLKEMMNEGSTSFESVHLHKDGSLLPVEVHARVTEWEGRRLVLSVSRDISGRLRAEEEIRRSLERLQRVLEGTVQAIASTGEVRDPYTAGHERRVAQLACSIGREMALPEERIEGIRIAGLLHDIGKTCVPAEILNKPGAVSEIELSILRTHSRHGYDILSAIEFPWPVATVVLQHHERLDGSGYPCGIRGEAILLEAKILAVADVVEAMSSHRPYRPALGINRALEEIAQNSGLLYERKVVEKCLELFGQRGFVFNEAEVDYSRAIRSSF